MKIAYLLLLLPLPQKKRSDPLIDAVFANGNVQFDNFSHVNGSVAVQGTLRHIVYITRRNVVVRSQLQFPLCYRYR